MTLNARAASLLERAESCDVGPQVQHQQRTNLHQIQLERCAARINVVEGLCTLRLAFADSRGEVFDVEHPNWRVARQLLAHNSAASGARRGTTGSDAAR